MSAKKRSPSETRQAPHRVEDETPQYLTDLYGRGQRDVAQDHSGAEYPVATQRTAGVLMARLWNLAETAHICFDKGKNATSSLLITLLINRQLQIAEHL